MADFNMTLKARATGVYCAGRGQLESIPASVLEIATLQVLDISYNAISSLPPEIGNCVHLQEIFASNNHIDCIPPDIGHLSALKRLHLSYNCINELPMEMGRVTTLQQLHISHNKLVVIPHSIGLLANLTVLNVSNNLLTALPEAIGYLHALQSLQASNNELSDIPESIGKLLFLTKLNVSWNRLTSLPASLSSLERLEDIRAGHNYITHVPDSLLLLPRLQVLDVRANPLTSVTEVNARISSKQLATGNSSPPSLPGEDLVLRKSLSFITPLTRSSKKNMSLPMPPASPEPNHMSPVAGRLVDLLQSGTTWNTNSALRLSELRHVTQEQRSTVDESHTTISTDEASVGGLKTNLHLTLLKQQEQLHSRVHEAQSTLTRTQQENQRLVLQVKELQERLDSVTQSRDATERAAKTAHSQCHQLQVQWAQLQTTYASLVNEHAFWKSKCAETEAARDRDRTDYQACLTAKARELQQALERLQEAQNKLRDEQTYNDSAAHRRHIAGESMQQMIADWSTKLSAAQLEQEELQKQLDQERHRAVETAREHRKEILSLKEDHTVRTGLVCMLSMQQRRMEMVRVAAKEEGLADTDSLRTGTQRDITRQKVTVSERNELITQLRTANGVARDLQQKVIEYETRIARMQEMQGAYDRSHNESREQHADQMDVLRDEALQLRNTCDTMQSELSRRDSLIQRLRQGELQMSSDSAKLREELNEMRLERTKLENDYRKTLARLKEATKLMEQFRELHLQFASKFLQQQEVVSEQKARLDRLMVRHSLLLQAVRNFVVESLPSNSTPVSSPTLSGMNSDAGMMRRTRSFTQQSIASTKSSHGSDVERIVANSVKLVAALHADEQEEERVSRGTATSTCAPRSHVLGTLLEQHRLSRPATPKDVFAAVVKYSENLVHEVAQFQQQWDELGLHNPPELAEPMDVEDKDTNAARPVAHNVSSRSCVPLNVTGLSEQQGTAAPYDMEG